MNNTIKAGFRLKQGIPISNMVHHENVICTISKHTCDLLFSLPSVEKHLLPMILEDDMGSPVFVFVDQNGEEWIKESDVVRNGVGRLREGCEFELLMDDIDDTKIKLFGMLSKRRMHTFSQLQDMLIAKYGSLREVAEANSSPDKSDIDSWVNLCRNSSLIDSIYLMKPSMFNFGQEEADEISEILHYLHDYLDESKLILVEGKLVNTKCSGSYKSKMFNAIYEFVYIMDFSDKIKIGRSTNPFRRLSDFNRAFLGSIRSFYLCEKSKSLESKTHREFSRSVVSGEFFSTSILEEVEEYLGKNSLLSFDAKGNVFADNTPNSSSIKKFSDLSDLIRNKSSLPIDLSKLS